MVIPIFLLLKIVPNIPSVMVDCLRPRETPCEYTLVDQKSPVVVEYLQQKQTDRQCQAAHEHLESWHELIKSHAHKSSTSSYVFTLGLLRQPQHPVAVQDTGLPLPPHSGKWKMYQSPRGTCLPAASDAQKPSLVMKRGRGI